MVDATDGIAIGVLHGCIGKCCTEKYPSVFVNLADEAIWKFVYKNAGLPCDGLELHGMCYSHLSNGVHNETISIKQRGFISKVHLRMGNFFGKGNGVC